jgi:peptidoglycan L-alanyl-D-glutamate endopeptidase CwlK
VASYSKKSEFELNTCHPKLQQVFRAVLEDGLDHSVSDGHREKEEQDEAVRTGHSTTPFPLSKHNKLPSLAVDAMPYPVEWAALERGDDLAVIKVGFFAGYVLGKAKSLGIKLRWGGDWDMDQDLRDQKFNDWPHFELVEEI